MLHETVICGSRKLFLHKLSKGFKMEEIELFNCLQMQHVPVLLLNLLA